LSRLRGPVERISVGDESKDFTLPSMLILRSHASAWRFAEFNPATGHIRRIPVWKFLRFRRRQTDGWFSDIGGTFVALFRAAGQLSLAVGGDVIPFDDEVRIEHKKARTENELVISRGPMFRRSIRYSSPHPWPPLDRDLTPNVEEEQYDFGLFVHNVYHDASRRIRLAKQ
jgi:hypothetical protein